MYISNFVCKDKTAFYLLNLFNKSYLNDVFCNNGNKFIHFDLLDAYRRSLLIIVNEFAYRIKDSNV